MLGRARRRVGRLRGQPQTARSRLRRKRERATPPNVIGKGPLLSAPGLQLGVVVILRNEAPYLEEWLAYHRALGVQHFFIYDNGSTDELNEVIEAWLNHGLVTLVHWPLPGGQIDAYSHALRFYGPSVEWLAFIDVDEFIVPLVDDDIRALLARWPEAADVRIPRVDFGFSGHRAPPQGLTIEAYTEVADVFGRDPDKPPRVKTVARPRAVSAVGIHTASLADEPVDATGQPVEFETIGRACHAYVQLNHYYTRSFEEFEAKRFRGSATGRIARPAIPFDLPALRVDRSAQRFAAHTRATMEHVRSLAASPYRYGSELELAQFPRFNDLGLFAEFAIANAVLDEAEPVREPRLRIENRYLGIGFVGDIGGYDHRVRRGELTASPHLTPLLERSRGRLEQSWAGTPELVASTLSGGSAEVLEAGWSVTPRAGAVEVALPLEVAGQRRCYALGFVLHTPGPAELTLSLVGADGSTSSPLGVLLATASTYAGVVEFDASPSHVSAAHLGLQVASGELLVHDLFVISYG